MKQVYSHRTKFCADCGYPDYSCECHVKKYTAADLAAAVTEERIRIVRGEFAQICGYCGYETKVGDWQELQDHINSCDKHPLYQLKQDLAAAEAVAYRRGMKAGRIDVDYKRLSDRLTEVVAQGLHYTENMEQINTMKTAKEVSAAINGGIARYRNDYLYNAKVKAMVAQLLQTIREEAEK